MYLKSLSLKGFKSFAERTTLEFEPGVAVVVGPNGSGKSNVVDAVAWALGAQGARSLRGGKMDDVIFAGTPKRPAAAKAEVSLTIDNSDGTLPIEGSRVTITRSLSRDGESGYAINGVSCRLLDITELLSDTGVGRTQHIIVGQGRLDAILHASPGERRAVIEEAAGILKYRQRKEKAERRLAATAVNLDRLTDLVKEVRRHLKPLERQADAARRHGGLNDELRALRLHLAGRELANLTERLEQLGARRETLADAEGEARERAAALGQVVAVAEAALSISRRTPWAMIWPGRNRSSPGLRGWAPSWPRSAAVSTVPSWPWPTPEWWRPSPPKPPSCATSWPRPRQKRRPGCPAARSSTRPSPPWERGGSGSRPRTGGEPAGRPLKPGRS